MGDLIIDFRDRSLRNSKAAAHALRYLDDMKVGIFQHIRFDLAVCRADDWRIWAPFWSEDLTTYIALAGRVALDHSEWRTDDALGGTGGIACARLYQRYLSKGIGSFVDLNGHFAAIVVDIGSGVCHIATDRSGMVLCFYCSSDPNDGLIIGTHQEIVAKIAGVTHDWDYESLAEFLGTGRVSFPYTYYSRIRALDYGAIHSIDLHGVTPRLSGQKRYFNFNFKIDRAVSEMQLAEDLSVAFFNAVNRRTDPVYGKTAVSLSAGLDSRAILCSVANKSDIAAFCFYDEQNLEFKLASQIAAQVGVPLLPLRRSFEHYGDYATKGVEISGGMGDFGSNHYLGFRSFFTEAGIENIISGFYCDYLFKGLVLEKKKGRFLRREVLESFRYQRYMPHFFFDSQWSDSVRERLRQLFPDHLVNDMSEEALLEVQRRRIFPLYYEPDNQETVVPQRVLGWFLPTIDNEIMEVYLRTPASYKLNASMFTKMVQLRCGRSVSSITDINTGASVSASQTKKVLAAYRKAILKRVSVRKKQIATQESWPNWEYYINNSLTIKELWTRNIGVAEDILIRLTGQNPFKKDPREYHTYLELKLFLRLLTLKLWINSHE